jgi:hypothetical protein
MMVIEPSEDRASTVLIRFPTFCITAVMEVIVGLSDAGGFGCPLTGIVSEDTHSDESRTLSSEIRVAEVNLRVVSTLLGDTIINVPLRPGL